MTPEHRSIAQQIFNEWYLMGVDDLREVEDSEALFKQLNTEARRIADELGLVFVPRNTLW